MAVAAATEAWTRWRTMAEVLQQRTRAGHRLAAPGIVPKRLGEIAALAKQAQISSTACKAFLPLWAPAGKLTHYLAPA